MPKKRAHLNIHGQVQDVFFRAYFRDRAEKNNLTGWAKNSFDGTLEVVLEGEEGDVAEVVHWAHEGPPNADVKKVDITWEKVRNEFDDFSIRH